MSKYDNKIPEISSEAKSDDRLTDAIVDHPVELPEQCFKISFEKYKHNKCQFDELERASYKKALEWIKKVCSYTTQEEVYRYGRGRSVIKAQHYAFLFKDLDEDSDLHEFYLAGTNRIFYYIDDANKIINCILFTSNHLKY